MFAIILSFFASQMLFLALHLESSSFPKPLSKEREREEFIKLKNGDDKAFEVLVAHNLRLVAHIVKKYYAGATETEDLISIGTIGLIKAVRSFNMEKNASFSTYGARCIENEILMLFRASKKSQGTLSLTEPIEGADGENGISIMEVVSDKERVDENFENKEEIKGLYHKLEEKLTEVERKVIVLRYGLGNKEPKTQ
ncbi:MAG: sigma-70 family RNA polymerase sigma factor, partial [Oscillospiraceae bacterium]